MLDLEAIKARADAATAGPWEKRGPVLVYGNLQYDQNSTGDSVATTISPRDATFIAAARADVPALVAEVERLRAALEFQAGVDAWMNACFGPTIKADMLERADRFVEEALELAQTMPGFGPERAHALVDYVFGRPVGHRPQEVGGVMVTLAALCNAAGIGINEAAQTELERVWTKVEAIRAKHAAKPTGSALPIALGDRP